MGEKIRDSNKTYSDVSMKPYRLWCYARRTVSALDSGNSTNVCKDPELRATFSRNEVIKSALAKFQNLFEARNFFKDSGRVMSSFGMEAGTLVDRIVQIYENDAVVFENSCEFV